MLNYKEYSVENKLSGQNDVELIQTLIDDYNSGCICDAITEVEEGDK